MTNVFVSRAREKIKQTDKISQRNVSAIRSIRKLGGDFDRGQKRKYDELERQSSVEHGQLETKIAGEQPG